MELTMEQKSKFIGEIERQYKVHLNANILGSILAINEGREFTRRVIEAAEKFGEMPAPVTDPPLVNLQRELEEGFQRLVSQTRARLGVQIQKAEGFRKRWLAQENISQSILNSLIEQERTLVGLQESFAEAIREVSFFKYTGVRDGCIILNTPMVTLTLNELEVDLGPFEVNLDLEEKRVYVYGISGAIEVDGYVHPHVTSSGSPCFGSATYKFREAMARMDIAKVLRMTQAMLTQYNPNSTYKRLELYYVQQLDADMSKFPVIYLKEEELSSHEIEALGDRLDNYGVYWKYYAGIDRRVDEMRYVRLDNGAYEEIEAFKTELMRRQNENSNTAQDISEDQLPSDELPF
jgi:hypothetical protein